MDASPATETSRNSSRVLCRNVGQPVRLQTGVVSVRSVVSSTASLGQDSRVAICRLPHRLWQAGDVDDLRVAGGHVVVATSLGASGCTAGHICSRDFTDPRPFSSLCSHYSCPRPRATSARIRTLRSEERQTLAQPRHDCCHRGPCPVGIPQYAATPGHYRRSLSPCRPPIHPTKTHQWQAVSLLRLRRVHRVGCTDC